MPVAALIINFNTAELTGRCVASLAGQSGLARILVIDNASTPDDIRHLREVLGDHAELLCSPENLGFAAGSNLGIAHLLRDPGIDAILLLNSDAEAESALVEAMQAALDPRSGVALVGAPMHHYDQPRQVDSLGIAFYASCLASNRLDPADPLFGPTGGCALYARELLEDLVAQHGCCFDPAFFCYAEDTDLAARALLLGYQPRLIETPGARHHGQASSGGGFSAFVLYHGIRNSIWMMLRCVPLRVLLRRLPWILLLHLGIVLRHGRRGEWRTLWHLYLDALRRFPNVLRERRLIQASRRIQPARFAAFVSNKFYDRGYLRDALRALLWPDRDR